MKQSLWSLGVFYLQLAHCTRIRGGTARQAVPKLETTFANRPYYMRLVVRSQHRGKRGRASARTRFSYSRLKCLQEKQKLADAAVVGILRIDTVRIITLRLHHA